MIFFMKLPKHFYLKILLIHQSQHIVNTQNRVLKRSVDRISEILCSHSEKPEAC